MIRVNEEAQVELDRLSAKIQTCLRDVCDARIDYTEGGFTSFWSNSLTAESVEAVNDLEKQAYDITKTKNKAISFDNLQKAFKDSFEKVLELTKKQRQKESSEKSQEANLRETIK